MNMIKASILLALAASILSGCMGKDEYPSTSTVKLELLKPGETGDVGSIEEIVYQYQPRIISGSSVLSKAANGSITRILWAEKNTSSSGELTTKDFVQTKILEAMYGEKESLYEKRVVPSDAPVEPVKNILAKSTAKNTLRSENEIVKMLSRSIEVEVDQSKATVKITAYSDDPAAAAGIADAVAAAYVSFLEEDNARKIEEMIKVGRQYKKEREKLGTSEDLSKMREQLSEIQNKYKLSLDENGNPKRPDEIAEKEKEKAILRPEITRIKTEVTQLNAGSFDDRVRHFSLNGNTSVSEQSKKVSDSKLEVKKLEIEFSKDEGDKEKKKANLLAAETKLKSEEAKLTDLVTALMDELSKDLAEKETSLEKLNSEIKELEDNFFTGGVKYSELVSRIENAKKSQEIQNKESMAIGSFLNATVLTRGEISPSTVHRPGSWDIKWIAIGGGIGLVIIMNAVFIIYMVRRTKNNQENYQEDEEIKGKKKRKY